jgi:hypothetical protein
VIARASSDVVIACLDDVRAGRRTAAQCLAEHPEAAAELRKLLAVATAVHLRETPHLDDAAKLRGRAQLLAAIGSNGHHAAEDRRMFGWRPILALGPRWLAAFGAALGAVVAGGAVVYAAQGAPPDSPLYPVQQAVQVVAQVVNPPTPTPSPTPLPALAAPTGQQAAPPAAGLPAATPRGSQGGTPADGRGAGIAPAPSRGGDKGSGNRGNGNSAEGRPANRGDGNSGDGGPANRAVSASPEPGRRGEADGRDNAGGGQPQDDQRGNGRTVDQRAEDRRVAPVPTPRASATSRGASASARGDNGDDHGDSGGDGRRANSGGNR